MKLTSKLSYLDEWRELREKAQDGEITRRLEKNNKIRTIVDKIAG